MLEIRSGIIVAVSKKQFFLFHNYNTLSYNQWVETQSNSNCKWGGLEFPRLYDVLVVTFMTFLVVMSIIFSHEFQFLDMFRRFNDCERNLSFQMLLDNLKLKSTSITSCYKIVFMSKPVFLSSYFILLSDWLCLESTMILKDFIVRIGSSGPVGQSVTLELENCWFKTHWALGWIQRPSLVMRLSITI